MTTQTIAQRRHWNQKYALGSTHATVQADADLIRLGHHFPTSGLALDIACGTGGNSVYLADMGLDVVCIDFSARGLDFLIQHRAKQPAGNRLHPLLADVAHTPLADESAEVIVVIRYLDRRAFAHYLTLLKPNGLLFIKTFNDNRLHRKPDFNRDYLLRKGELAAFFRHHAIIASNDTADNTDEASMILVRK